MAKPPKKTAAPRIPNIGDRVKRRGSESIYLVNSISKDGTEAEIVLKDTNLQWFRFPVENLVFLDEPKPEAAKPMPTIDIEKIKERMATAQQQSIQHLDDDLAILIKYLKTEGVSKAGINALETLKREQRESWEEAVDRIVELLDEA